MSKRIRLTRLPDGTDNQGERGNQTADSAETWQALVAEADERAKEGRRQGWHLRKRMMAMRVRRASDGDAV